MKTIITGALVAATVTFTACNNSNNNAHEAHQHDTAAMAMKQGSSPADHSIVQVKPRFTNVDANVMASLTPVFGHYLHLKNSLAADNSAEAASSGKAMEIALEKVDKAAMTPEQQKVYHENEDDLKEHAEHIGRNEGNIAHQREHFAQMSEDVYALVKAFGGKQTLYHDYCPMYNDNKGALWLSETKDIQNPYMGSKMPACGSVKEMIQ